MYENIVRGLLVLITAILVGIIFDHRALMQREQLREEGRQEVEEQWETRLLSQELARFDAKTGEFKLRTVADIASDFEIPHLPDEVYLVPPTLHNHTKQ